jgi:uracil-DNA glycosylase
VTYQQLHEIEESWSACVKCPQISTNRDKSNQKIVFGAGYSDAIGLVITDLPFAGGKETSEEWDILQKIWTKAGIDERDWYTTASIACPKKQPPTGTEIINCRDRISEMVYSVSPAIVILAGFEAYVSFFGKSPKGDAVYEDVGHYHTYFTHSVSEYLRERTSDKTRAQTIAAKMFADWQSIGKLMKKVKTE